jgi:FkbM family methyltransferase
MLVQFVTKALGKPLTWRIGRALYLAARNESRNDIATNGEAALIRAIAGANRASGTLAYWDVGGNLGDWTRIALDAAAAVNCAVSVDVFEPAPAAADHLENRFGGNPSVRVHRCALAAEAGTARMDIFAPTQGTNALAIAGEDTGANAIEVVVKTGDGVSAELQQDDIHLIKIDAEGHDMAIVSGCLSMLAAGKVQVMQFEYNHRWLATRTSLRQLMALVAGTSYSLAKVTGDGLQIIPDWNPETDRYFETNYALVRHDMIDRLGAQRCVWNESNVLVGA